MTHLSVVVPIYNEEENIYDLYLSITEAIRGRIEHYEIVLVNDGSRDRSAALLNEIAQMDQVVKVIHFEKNYGQTAAIWAGIKNSQGELIALMDAALQTDPRNIFRLMPFIKKRDFVNGKWADHKDTWLKKISSGFAKKIRNWIIGDSIYDIGCPMKLFKREVADSFYLYNGMHRFLPTVAKMNGFSVIEVTVTHQARKHGTSKYGEINRGGMGFMDAILIGWLRKRVILYRIKR
ncbi:MULTISPECIES: glycosyltransferase family 2 protein [Paenibacillus]|uniref:glycosyltransferase family 2 protein n=1 Tax=Paenibacillus TaxID=44249 RepID=UPI00096E39FC|nr:glycosyltransferase family 2 protein [Paenibacillus odorifer]OME09842.1 glycosyltransferase [Paenibacillus odorifer]